MEPSKTPPRRGIPLTVLFLLITVCGMLAGAISVALRHQPETVEDSSILATICAVVIPLATFLAGILVGVGVRGTRFLGALLGGIAGLAVAATQAVVGLAPSDAMPELLVILVAGSAMMLLIGVVGRVRANT